MMFLEDLKDQRLTPILSLDLLHLCRKGLQSLENKEGGGISEILGIMGRSPLLLYRFLEWQQDTSNEQSSFRLSHYLLNQGAKQYLLPAFKHLHPHFKGNFKTSALLHHCRSFVLDHLPEAFSSKYDTKQKSRPGFISFNNRIPHCLEQHLYEASSFKGSLAISDDKDDLSKENLRKCRRHLEQCMTECFEDLVLKIERQVLQVLGKKGVSSFLEEVLSKVSFLSLLGLDRGSKGDHLYLLNLHATTVGQCAKELGTKLHQLVPNGIKGFPSPEDLFIMGLIHDLGHALMATHFPELHGEIWDRLIDQQANKEEGQLKNPSSFRQIEKNIITHYQISKLTMVCRDIPMEDLVPHFESHSIETQNHTQQDLHLMFSKLYLNSFKSDQSEHKWVKKLWQNLNLPEHTPLFGSGDLAATLLKISAEGQEFVKGAYGKYANFISAYNKERSSALPVLYIRHINQMSTQLAEGLDFSFPCSYGNIGDAECFDRQDKLCEGLGIEVEALERLSEEVVRGCMETWKSEHPFHSTNQTQSPLTRPQRLQHDLQLNISDFFKSSQFFTSGYHRFNHLNHQIITVLQKTSKVTPVMFVHELENALKHFFRVMEVVVVPRQKGTPSTPEDHFSVLFKSAGTMEDMACYHHRHLMADIYLLDPSSKKVEHHEIGRFMSLFCDHLLLNYSSEIWELFKGQDEVARLDIAKIMVKQYRLGDGLGAQLLYFKARLLDGLVPRFSKEKEPLQLSKIQFAVYKPHRSPPFELYPTADYDYWQQSLKNDQRDPPDFKAIADDLCESLNGHGDQVKPLIEHHSNDHPIEVSLYQGTGPVPHLVMPLFDMKDEHGSKFVLIVANATLRKDGLVVQALIDKGIAQELSKHQQASQAPIGYTFLQFFSSDDSNSALNRITHLRPSRLKEMGILLHQVQREVQPHLHRLPPIMESELMDLLDAFRTFWDQYHHELTQHERLSKPALKNFDHLRKKSDQYKKSIRIKIPDLIHLIDHIPRGNLGKLRLKDPIINIPWGLEFLYLSHTAFGQFKDSVDRKITYGHPQLRSASETLHKLDSAWFLAHPKHLQQALLSFFEELSRESHIIQSDAPVSCSITLFLHHEAVPHFPSSAGPFLVLECFTPSETKEGAHHRVVSSAGGGYQSIFKEEFLEFCAVAHRNVIQKGDQFLMECFFRSTDDASSLRYVEPHMLKHRFYNRTGLSTLFFFPIRSQNLGRQNHHGF